MLRKRNEGSVQRARKTQLLCKPRPGRVALALTFGLGLGLLANKAPAEIPAPDHTFYGSATESGVLVAEGVIEVKLVAQPFPLAIYSIGSEPGLGDFYVLRVPMDFEGDRIEGAARPGDAVEFFIGGELAGRATVGTPGESQTLNLDTFFDESAELTITSLEIAEGDGGTSFVDFHVGLSRPIAMDATAQFATQSGTAQAALDFVPASGTLTVAAGTTSTVISVGIIGDTVVEPPETFVVTLSDPVNAELAGAGQAIGTIAADDAQSVLYVTDSQILEGDLEQSMATFHLFVEDELPTRAGATVTVSFNTEDGSAIAGIDYVATSGIATIDLSEICADYTAPCAEIQVPVLADNEQESDEQFRVVLSNPEGAVLGDTEATGTIYTDEHFLQFVEAQLEGPNGSALQGATDIVVSPDGRHAYVASQLANRIDVFGRAPDGSLDYLSSISDSVVTPLAGVRSLSFNTDGSTLYAAAFLADSLTILNRDSGSGGLTADAHFMDGLGGVDGLDGIWDIEISTDDCFAYASGNKANAIAIFDVGSCTVAPGYLGQVKQGVLGIQGLLGVSGLAISVDGTQLYATSFLDSSLVTFSRDSEDGSLLYLGRERDGVDGVNGLGGAREVSPSPDNRHLYAAAELDNAITVFKREAGDVDFVEQKVNGLGVVEGLGSVSDVAVSPDGDLVFGAGKADSAISVFSRTQLTGALAFVEARYDGTPEPAGRTVDGLSGTVSLALGPEADGRHVYATGFGDDGAAVFLRDTQAPSEATLSSPSHPLATWTTASHLILEWSGSVDNEGGSGVRGYSFVLDQESTTVPDVHLDLGHDHPDLQSFSTSLSQSGPYYFHLRSCDVARNCGQSVHYGPILIDFDAPRAPSHLQSSSHSTDTPSENSVIAVSWASALDDLSGLDGYEAFFNKTATSTCFGSVTLGVNAVGTTSEPLEDGDWYFHICAIDAVGNVSPASHLGPFTIDAVPATITDFSTTSAPSVGVVEDGDRLDVPVSQLHFTFSEPMEPLSVASFVLIEAGPDEVLNTTSCGAPVGDDIVEQLSTAIANFDETHLTLSLDAASSLRRGAYRVLSCELLNANGFLLDGDTDGVSGGTYSLDFNIIGQNFLTNSNFDDSIINWMTSTTTGNSQFSTTDSEGILTSGSLRLSVLNAPVTTRQCAPQETREFVGEQLALSLRVRNDDGVDVAVQVAAAVDGECDQLIETTDWFTLEQDPSEDFVEWRIDDLGLQSARFVLLQIEVTSVSAEPNEVYVDSVFLGTVGGFIFEDGFESGDASAWQ